MSGADTFHARATDYDRHIGRYGPSLAAAFVDFVGVAPGMDVLDVGCGPGALTRVLADRLGPEHVAAADPSASFAAATRERIPGAEIVSARAEELPFADARFDATLSQLVLNFVDDPVAGVTEMRRVTRPGGIVGACVWDYAGEMTLLRAFWEAAREVAPDRARLVDESAVMSLCAEEDLARLWTTSALEDVRSRSLLARASYASFSDLWAPFPAGVGPAGAFCASLDDDSQRALRDALGRRLDVGDEPFELTARAWAVTGRRGA